MFRTIEDFQSARNYEAEMTGKLFLNLTDESLGQKVCEDGRTLGFLVWHIRVTLHEMLDRVGLKSRLPLRHWRKVRFGRGREKLDG